LRRLFIERLIDEAVGVSEQELRVGRGEEVRGVLVSGKYTGEKK